MFVDLALVFLTLLLGFLGFRRGLFSQVWGLLALSAAFWGANPLLIRMDLPALLGTEAEGPFGVFMMQLLVGLVLYILLLVLGRLLEYVLIEQLSLIKAGNRVLGGIIGTLKGGIIALGFLWVGQFASGFFAQDMPKVLQSLDESVVLRTVGGYNPLNFLYLNRLRPYVVKENGPGRALPKSFESPALVALLGDKDFASALASGDIEAIVKNPVYRRAMADPRVSLNLAQLKPLGR